MADRLDPEGVAAEAQWRAAGDRMQTLLDASAAGGPVAQQRAEQLVREVTDLYGAGLERMMRLAEAADPQLALVFAGDDLVASLLLVHNLHPHPVERRVSDALESVRPYLGSHGGDVDLVEIADGVVRLRFSGSCRSCPSSSVTLELAVSDAIRAAAPEIESIDVVAAEAKPASVIPADSLLRRIPAGGRSVPAWHQVPDIDGLAPGEVGGFRVDGTVVLACRVDEGLFAYLDRCGSCGDSLAGARLDGQVLHCPRCDARFDVVHAGSGVDDTAHLEPVPLLKREGVLSMALHGGAERAPMAEIGAGSRPGLTFGGQGTPS